LPALIFGGLVLALTLGQWLSGGDRVLGGGEQAFIPAVISSEATPTPTPTQTPTPTPTPTATPVLVGPEWLQYVNQFRLEAALAPLTENVDWSYGDWLHGRYMVKEDYVGHSEDPASPWYTDEGNLAAQKGNVAVSAVSTAPDKFAVDVWMSGPFHAVAIVDPELHVTGFGSYRENIGLWKTGATLDVARGRGDIPGTVTFPLPYPRNGGAIWLRSHFGNEWPDPLAGCPGYSAPTGSPIILQLGDGSLTPDVTSTSFANEDGALEHCVFDETDYTHPTDSGQQSTGRVILNTRDAVVLLPRQPLQVNRTYTASITANGVTTTWSFTVVPPPEGAPDLETLGETASR
jgi:hypothetical protein